MSGTLHTQPHPEASCLVVTLENPGKRNAIDAALWRALGDLFTELAAEGLPWRSVILTGAGDAFAAGGDLEEFPRVRADLASAATGDAAAPRVRKIDGLASVDAVRDAALAALRS